jgi:gliding motility-associated-like protein
MTSFCDEACIICDINGFTGINNSTIQGQFPPDFCTGTAHHMQWIGFIAGTTNLTLSVSVFNCRFGQGLEVGIYESFDCKDFRLVSNCDGDIGPNTTQTFRNTEPLVVGQYYYFVMDGNANDVCNYTIRVVSGSTEVGKLENSGIIQGSPTSCPGVPLSFKVSPPVGSTQFTWTLNGAVVSTDSLYNTTFTQEGDYTLCFTASNVCDTAPPTCQTIRVRNLAPRILNRTVCAGDCYTQGDSLLCATGNYLFRYSTPAGCDSLVLVRLIVRDDNSVSFNTRICDGDTLYVAGTPLSGNGTYQVVATDQFGCDSSIYVNLSLILCNMQGIVSGYPPTCRGQDDGRLTFRVTQGTPPFTYSWTRIGRPVLSGTGTLAASNQDESILQLPAGTYVITIKDGFGNEVVLIGDVIDPDALSLTTTSKLYNGFDLSCHNSKDGQLTATGLGGVPPYGFVWSQGTTGSTASNLGPGEYTVTLTDANGCTLIGKDTLLAPPPLTLAAGFTDPGCDGPNTGKLQIQGTSGGVGPYLLELNGQQLDPGTTVNNLSPGPHRLTLTDANNCTVTLTDTLRAAKIPIITLGPDLTIDLADSIRLQVISNLTPVVVLWENTPGLSCYNCVEPWAKPVNNATYIVTVSSEDNCATSDTLNITVNKIRSFYVPSAFSPNKDGDNDQVNVFAGPQVKSVLKFRIFTRWGAEVYDGTGLRTNDFASGWDGYLRGKIMDAGVYVWVAEVEFIDDTVLQYSGDITLLR